MTWTSIIGLLVGAAATWIKNTTGEDVDLDQVATDAKAYMAKNLASQKASETSEDKTATDSL